METNSPAVARISPKWPLTPCKAIGQSKMHFCHIEIKHHRSNQPIRWAPLPAPRRAGLSAPSRTPPGAATATLRADHVRSATGPRRLRRSPKGTIALNAAHHAAAAALAHDKSPTRSVKKKAGQTSSTCLCPGQPPAAQSQPASPITGSTDRGLLNRQPLEGHLGDSRIGPVHGATRGVSAAHAGENSLDHVPLAAGAPDVRRPGGRISQRSLDAGEHQRSCRGR